MLVADFRESFLPLDVIRNQVHRPWPVERAQGDDVVNRFEIELLAETGHAAFQLEDADRFSAVQKRERRSIIEWHAREREIRNAFPDEFLGIMQDRKRPQSEEIHLEQTEVVEWPHRV